MKPWLMKVTRDLLYRKLRSLPCEGKHSQSVISDASCDACRPLWGLLYPQGWRTYQGDVCEHGAYVGGCGIDYMCGPCEDGYSYEPTFGEVVRDWWKAVQHKEVLSDTVPLAG